MCGRSRSSIGRARTTEHLRETAEKIILLPNAAANGFGPQAWMDDPIKAATRERWRDFVLSAGFKKIDVEVQGIDTLIADGLLEGDIVVDDVPLNSIMASRVFEIAIEKA
eukprot:6747634-Prymnesium_polylepis.1